MPPSTRKKTEERGEGLCIYIGPAHLSGFEAQTGTNGGARRLKPGLMGVPARPQQAKPHSGRWVLTISPGPSHSRD